MRATVFSFLKLLCEHADTYSEQSHNSISTEGKAH